MQGMRANMRTSMQVQITHTRAEEACVVLLTNVHVTQRIHKNKTTSGRVEPALP